MMMASQHGQWTSKGTLQFIRDYKAFPELWDATSKLYCRRDLKLYAYRALAAKYDMEVTTIKEKIKSLRTIFRREHIRATKVWTRPGEPEAPVYVPSWFAYEAMMFTAETGRYPMEIGPAASQSIILPEMMMKEEPQSDEHHLPTDQPDLDLHFECDEDPKDDGSEGILESDNCRGRSPQSSDSQETQEVIVECDPVESAAKRIRRIEAVQPTVLTVGQLSAMKRIQRTEVELESTPDESPARSRTTPATRTTAEATPAIRDRFTVFGELVAHKLRGLNHAHARLVTQHLIDNILFEAEMGKFDIDVPTFTWVTPRVANE